MRTTELLVTLLIAAVIAGAFYAGLTTDFAAFAGGLNRIILTLQGRTQSGQFAAYPTNAPAPAAVGFGG